MEGPWNALGVSATGRDASPLDAYARNNDGIRVQPVDITPFPQELAIRWDNGREDFVPMETLRRFCPCASCLGEKDIFGNTYKPPERPYVAASFQLRKLVRVGGYAVQPTWQDGHGTGIYTWDWLRQICNAVNVPADKT